MPRDYYDIYILAKLQYQNIEINAFKQALKATTEKRGSAEVMKSYRKIIETVKNSDVMKLQWNHYQMDFEYAMDIAFEDVCDTVMKLMEELL